MNAAKWEKLKELREQHQEYTNNFFDHLTETVTTLINEEGHFLVPTVEDLEGHELTTASYMQAAWEEVATQEGNVRMARLARDKARGRVRLQNRDHYAKTGGKLPTEAIQEAEMLQSPIVEEAERELAEAEAMLTIAKGTLDCIKFKGSLLPGLRGRCNREIES